MHHPVLSDTAYYSRACTVQFSFAADKALRRDVGKISLRFEPDLAIAGPFFSEQQVESAVGIAIFVEHGLCMALLVRGRRGQHEQREA